MGARLAFVAGVAALLLIALPQVALAQSPSSSGVGTVIVPPGATFGSISLSAGQVRIFGTVDGSVSVGVGQVDIAGTGDVTGDVHVGVGQVVLARGARVGGSASVGMGQIQRLSAGQRLPPLRSGARSVVTQVNVGNLVWPSLIGLIGLGPVSFLSLGLTRVVGWLVDLGVALLLLALFPKALAAIAGAMESAPGPAVGWGLLIMLATPPALVILAITVVGIPAVFVAALALAAAKVAGYTAASAIVGRRLGVGFSHGRVPSVPWQVVLGSAVFFVVGSAPVVGFLLDLAVTAFGLGAVALTGFGSGRPWFRKPAAAS